MLRSTVIGVQSETRPEKTTGIDAIAMKIGMLSHRYPRMMASRRGSTERGERVSAVNVGDLRREVRRSSVVATGASILPQAAQVL